MFPLNCFASESNQPNAASGLMVGGSSGGMMGAVAGPVSGTGTGVAGSSSGQQNSQNHRSFWSMCCWKPEQWTKLFGCGHCCLGLSTKKRKRRISFSHDHQPQRRVSFSDLNSTPNMVPECSKSEPVTSIVISTSMKECNSNKSVPEDRYHLENDNEHQKHRHHSRMQSFLFGFFRKQNCTKLNNSFVGGGGHEMGQSISNDNNQQHHHHHHDPNHSHHSHSPIMQLSVSALSMDNNCDSTNNTSNNQLELRESDTKLDNDNEHNHNQQQFNNNKQVIPLPSSSGINYSPMFHPNQNNAGTTSNAAAVATGTGPFSFAKSIGKRSKKSVVPANVMANEQLSQEQQQIRMKFSSKRLMKEIGNLMNKQQNQQLTANFSVELINDSLYEWYIKIYEFDKESQIYLDMQQYQIPFVQLHAIFSDSYPFEPPFIRVVSPYIERGYVMEGGAICLELLTKTGWTSAYTMELVIIQLMASFVKGQATIKATKDVSKCFTKKSAVNSFRHIVRIHDKHGWVDTPLNEG